MKPFVHHGEIVNSSQRLFVEPRFSTFVAVAIVGGATVAAGASVYASQQQSRAQRAAAQQQAQSQNNANATNLQEFEESRGSTGSAILPLYLTSGAGGQQFESQLGQDMVTAYNESQVPLSTFTAAAAPIAKAETKANEFTNDIFTGGVTNKLLAQARPVQQARLSSAKESAMTALNRTLDAIDAAQAGKGFSGDSFGNRSLRMGANLEAGNTISAAQLANMGETQQIQNFGDVTLPLQNLSLPAAMGQQNETLAFLPQANFLQSKVAQQQPFSFFRIGPGTPPAVQPLPTAPPSLSAGGAIAQGVGSVGSAALNYYLNQQLIQQQQSRAAQGASTAAATSTAAANANPFSTAPLVPYYGNPTSGAPIDDGSGALDITSLSPSLA